MPCTAISRTSARESSRKGTTSASSSAMVVEEEEVCVRAADSQGRGRPREREREWTGRPRSPGQSEGAVPAPVRGARRPSCRGGVPAPPRRRCRRRPRRCARARRGTRGYTGLWAGMWWRLRAICCAAQLCRWPGSTPSLALGQRALSHFSLALGRPHALDCGVEACLTLTASRSRARAHVRRAPFLRIHLTVRAPHCMCAHRVRRLLMAVRRAALARRAPESWLEVICHVGLGHGA